MATIDAKLDDVHRHLSDTIMALGECVHDPTPLDAGEMREIVRLLTLAQHKLAKMSPSELRQRREDPD